MSMQLNCPMDGCHATITGDTEDEIMDKAADHAREHHPDLELDEETAADLRSQIQTSP